MAFSVFFLLSSAFLSFTFSIDAAVSPPEYNITLTEFKELKFPVNVTSSGSVTFDFLGGGPYAGTTDGRILRYSRHSWEDYGYTSPNRTHAFCDGTTGFDRAATCGLTTGLFFKPFTLDLYACDAYVGLTFVRFLRRDPMTLVRNSDGVPPYLLLNSVDAASDGMVYFVDESAKYGPQDINVSLQTGDSTGRLLQYNPRTNKVTTLLSHLGEAVGVATNTDASFVLVSENNKNRIKRYWLRGEKAGASEIFLTFEGSPNKIERNQEGDFWVGLNIMKNGMNAPHGVKISPSGKILAIVDLSKEYHHRITMVLQQGDEIFVTGVNTTYVGRYTIVYN